jgi:hypothetical protein
MGTVGKNNGGPLPVRGLQLVVTAFAILLSGVGLAADQAWFDRHFLPIFAVQHSVIIEVEQALRGAVILTAALLLLAYRRPIAFRRGRASAGGTGDSRIDVAHSSAASP